MKILVLRGDHEGYVHSIESDLTIQLPPAQEKICDRWGQTYEVEYLDSDPIELVLVDCFRRIKTSWEKLHPIEDAHLGHSAAGMWYFYWFAPDMTQVSELVMQSRADDLRDAATDYIEAEFGAKRGPTLAFAAV